MRQALAALVALALFDASGAAQQSPAFSSKIEAVRVDVQVTDNGQPIRGLGPGDFEITRSNDREGWQVSQCHVQPRDHLGHAGQ